MNNTPIRPARPIRVKYTEEIVETICAAIRLDGVSDTSAGLLAGVSKQTICQWKKEQPGFADQLQGARAVFHRARLESIRLACNRDGVVDWRAQVWLAENAGLGEAEAPEKAETAAEELSPLLVVPPAQMVLLQQRRAAALARMKPRA